jgi:hypothetical protein
MYYELLHRILNLYGILRCTVVARTQAGREMIVQMSPIIRESVNNLCDYNITISKFMNLIFRWVFLWGGYFIKKDDSYRYELAELAKESGLSETNVFHFISIIRKVYGSGADLFYNDKEKIFIKYIPAQFRALGKLHRQTYSEYYNTKTVFREDVQNQNLLNYALADIGGSDNLQIKA